MKQKNVSGNRIFPLNFQVVLYHSKTLYTHRPLPKKPRSPGPIKITEVRVRYTNPFIFLLFKILWVVRKAIIQLVAKGIIYTCMCM